ncbi:hypothetical protein LPICM17_350114 [Lactococcus piscium]|nr:hypothetical protein LPICM17_350114 [Lactococcus piscium]
MTPNNKSCKIELTTEVVKKLEPKAHNSERLDQVHTMTFENTIMA